MAGGLAVGDDQQHRLGVGVLAEVAVGEQQRVVQVGALVPHRVERGELLDLHHPRRAAEADQLQVVAAEPAGDQLVQRERQFLALRGHGNREKRPVGEGEF